MKLLLLGGTVFLGRHIAQAALEKGHQVTLFHRGVHGPALFPAAEHVLGDRDGGLQPLAGRHFDAVIDTSGYLPRVVRQSAELLRDLAAHYTFISSISAYRSFPAPGLTEDAPLAELPEEAGEDAGRWYGALKAICEKTVRRSFPGRSLVIRPGLIVGPDDPSDRFTYWVDRLARGGEVLAPGGPDQPVQLIDVRDLAAFTLALAERAAIGNYNATGPRQPIALREVLACCREVSGGTGPITWVGEEFLAERGVEPWSELPLFIPQSDPDARGFTSVSIAQALGAGLSFRPLRETVRDTLQWDRAQSGEIVRRAGLSQEQIGRAHV